ncbi:hypothetical protein FB451DRAFT_189569 [Mycena latifolia]|nr:hypothetical protein FB451DRAFT_189569 [Mycena latifolia]
MMTKGWLERKTRCVVLLAVIRSIGTRLRAAVTLAIVAPSPALTPSDSPSVIRLVLLHALLGLRVHRFHDPGFDSAVWTTRSYRAQRCQFRRTRCCWSSTSTARSRRASEEERTRSCRFPDCWTRSTAWGARRASSSSRRSVVPLFLSPFSSDEPADHRTLRTNYIDRYNPLGRIDRGVVYELARHARSSCASPRWAVPRARACRTQHQQSQDRQHKANLSSPADKESDARGAPIADLDSTPPLWKRDLPRTSPSIPKPARPSDQIFHHDTPEFCFLLPLIPHPSFHPYSPLSYLTQTLFFFRTTYRQREESNQVLGHLGLRRGLI